jgi:hypothetical protein
VPVRAGGGTGTSNVTETPPTKFEMGGSIAVQLLRGDMNAAATGTVSYVDGNNVLAFGHPMFQTGETYAPVATSYVHTVVPSAASAFVLASPIKEIGSLTQDRQAMIAADTNLRTTTVPVSIQVNSFAGKRAEKGTFNVEVMDNKFLTPAITGAALMNAVNYYLPDRDDVTARVESSVKIKGGQPIEFVDYLYANDGASSVMGAHRAHHRRAQVRSQLRRHQRDPRAGRRAPRGSTQHDLGPHGHVGRQGHHRGRRRRRAEESRRRHRQPRGHRR